MSPDTPESNDPERGEQPPGKRPPPEEGEGDGGSLPEFLRELRNLVDDLEVFLADREISGDSARRFAEVVSESLSGLRSELDRFEARAPGEGDTLPIAESVLATTSATPLIAAQRNTISELRTEAAQSEAFQTGLAISETVFKKIALYLPDGPWKGAISDIAELIALTGKLTSSTGDQLKRIEQKVASLQESINGTRFPEGEISGPVAGGRPALRDEVEELEEKIERFFEGVLGNPVPRDEDGAIQTDPLDEVEYPTIPRSVLWMAWDLERKLQHVFGRLSGEEFPRNARRQVIEPVSVSRDRSVEGTLDELRIKIDTLAKLLGKTLYDVKWNVEPDEDGRLRTIAPGARPENDTPPRSIKDEIHDLEDLLNEVLRLLRIILRLLRRKCPDGDHDGNDDDDDNGHENGNGDVFPVDVKRIFVYDEGVFEAASASDELKIQVRTGAFDLGGWIDLTELDDGDEVEFEMHVRLPGGVRRLYKSATFRESADAGLRAIYDIVGQGPVMGDAVDLVVRQSGSATGYAPPVSIAYQVVVESQ